MLYKPNFCCHCGEKVERVEWNLLTSRRFCVACSMENRLHELVPRLAVVAGALAMMFGFGSLWTGSGRATPAGTENGVEVRSSTIQHGSVRSAGTASENHIEVAPSSNVQPPVQVVTVSPTNSQSEEKSGARFFCGALTKKGTPCSRKVKAKGLRCFQHEGRPEAQNPD